MQDVSNCDSVQKQANRSVVGLTTSTIVFCVAAIMAICCMQRTWLSSDDWTVRRIFEDVTVFSMPGAINDVLDVVKYWSSDSSTLQNQYVMSCSNMLYGIAANILYITAIIMRLSRHKYAYRVGLAASIFTILAAIGFVALLVPLMQYFETRDYEIAVSCWMTLFAGIITACCIEKSVVSETETSGEKTVEQKPCEPKLPWECTTCGQINAGHVVTCQVCGTTRAWLEKQRKSGG